MSCRWSAVCGGEVWRGTEGSSSSRRQDGLPAPGARAAPRVSRERGGSHRARGSLQEPCGSGVALLCFWFPVMQVLEFFSRSKAEGLFVPCLPHYQGCDGRGLGTALAGPWQCSPVCRGMGRAGSVLCPSLQSVPSIPGWMGEPRRRQWGCSQLGLQPQAPSRAAFGRGSWAKPRAPYTVNQAVQVGSQPKPERKGEKWVSFLELSLAPAETEGAMILHHFAFSLPPLTQAVPRTRCVLPGLARAHRMPKQELLSHEDAVGRPCSHLRCPRREVLPGSCSPVSLFSWQRGFSCKAWKARAQGLLPVPIPSCQPHVSREHSPSLAALRAVAKRLLFSRLFSQCTPASCAQQWHCQGWRRAGVCPPCWRSPVHGTVQGQGSPPGWGPFPARPRPL